MGLTKWLTAPVQFLVTVAVILTFATMAAAQTEKTLFNFGQYQYDGEGPFGTPLFDSHGNIFGTTFGGGYGHGTVFELSPDGHGGWTETILYRFLGKAYDDGDQPYDGLISDAQGNLYGTTYMGGHLNTGTVFELSQNAGVWTETVLYSFKFQNQVYGPYGSLVMDDKGALYGTADRAGGFGGGVFKLTPPLKKGDPWKETIIHKFGIKPNDGVSPESSLIFDKAGALYGTTVAGGTRCNGGSTTCGTVFKLTPSVGGTWKEEILHRFKGAPSDGWEPSAGLTFDKNGALYGTTQLGGRGTACFNQYNCGIIFQLSPNGGHWTERVIHNFQGGTDGAWPISSLAQDSKGAFYGTTSLGGYTSQSNCPTYSNGCGTIFKISPPKKQGGAWSEKVLYRFTNYADGASPAFGGLVFDKAGNLYGTAINVYPGNGYSGDVFEILP